MNTYPTACAHVSRSAIQRQGYALIHGKLREVTYEVANGIAYYQGDIILGTVAEMDELDRLCNLFQGDLEQLGTYRPTGAWPNKAMSYCIAANAFSPPEIDKAAQHIKEKTGINVRNAGAVCNLPIRPVTPLVNALFYTALFVGGNECSSQVGWQGLAPQIITLGEGCGYSVAIHEICHALGLYHEQSRPDRDDYVEILWDNIPEDKRHNFAIEPDAAVASPYDYYSIMHYGMFDFAIDPRKPTIVPKKDAGFIGAWELSDGDVAALRALYP